MKKCLRLPKVSNQRRSSETTLRFATDLPMETLAQHSPQANNENANVAALMPKFLLSSFPFPNRAITASKVVNEAQNLRQNTTKNTVGKLSSAARGHWLLKECDDDDDSCGSVRHETLDTQWRTKPQMFDEISRQGGPKFPDQFMHITCSAPVQRPFMNFSSPISVAWPYIYTCGSLKTFFGPLLPNAIFHLQLPVKIILVRLRAAISLQRSFDFSVDTEWDLIQLWLEIFQHFYLSVVCLHKAFNQ